MLPDGTNTDHQLSALQGGDPMLVVLIRSLLCPKDREQLASLARVHALLGSGCCKLVAITTDASPAEAAEATAALNVLLHDQAQQVRDTLDIAVLTDDGDEPPLIPHTFLLAPGLSIRKVWNAPPPVGTAVELRAARRVVRAHARAAPRPRSPRAGVAGSVARSDPQRHGCREPRGGARRGTQEHFMIQVSDVMTRGVRALSPKDTVTMAAQAMQELDVGAIPVCNQERLVGIVTDRDLVLRGVAQARLDASTPIDDVMSRQPLWCFEDQPVEDVLAYMRKAQVRRVPVIDRENRLVGMVSLGDLAVRGDEEQAGSALRSISEPAKPDRSHLSQASGTAGGGASEDRSRTRAR